MRSFSQVLLTTPASGPEVARANLSARQAKAAGLMTSGTCGLPSTISSKSVVLQRFLENRLRRKTALLGSTLFKMTWKQRTTPSGRAIFALRASVPRISVSVSIGQLSGWVTASARDWKDTPGMATVRPDGRSRIDQLPRQAQLASWGTPLAQQANGSPEAFLERKRKSIAKGSRMGIALSDLNMQAQANLSGWPTTTQTDAIRHPAFDHRAKNVTLNHAAVLAHYPTPQARDYFPAHTPEYIAAKKRQGHGMANLNDVVQQVTGPARLTASGEWLIGYHAETESGGQLNPAHSRRLMGLPPVWDACAPTETPSSRRKQSSSAGLSASLSRLSTAVSRLLRHG